MSNLAKKGLLQSTVFQYGVLVDTVAVGLWSGGDITGVAVLETVMAGLALYAAKEGIAKGSEAYRDKKTGE